MGTKSQHTNPRTRLEEISKDREVRFEDREYFIEFINMSVRELVELAYQEGFKDGMSFITKEKE
jgi:hypothetical protein